MLGKIVVRIGENSGPFYRHTFNRTSIPPMAMGGYFKSFLRRDLNNPPTTVGGIRTLLCKFWIESI